MNATHPDFDRMQPQNQNSSSAGSHFVLTTYTIKLVFLVGVAIYTTIFITTLSWRSEQLSSVYQSNIINGEGRWHQRTPHSTENNGELLAVVEEVKVNKTVAFCGNRKWSRTKMSCNKRAIYMVEKYGMSLNEAKSLLLMDKDGKCICANKESAEEKNVFVLPTLMKVFDDSWVRGVLPKNYGENRSQKTTNNGGWRRITSSTGRSRTLHIIHCLSGSEHFFIEEWEVGFKSILVNAPLDSNLHVHLIADNDAAAAINAKIINSKIVGSVWRNEVFVVVHNIEEMLPSWKKFLTDSLTNDSNRDWMDRRVGIGGYLRLLAQRVVVPFECGGQICTEFEKRDLQEALYSDTDVVIIGNLNNLMQTTANILEEANREGGKRRPLWIWNQNSGFMILDLLNFEKVWELAATIPNEIRDAEVKMKGDQWFLVKVQDHFPHENVTALLPDEWSTHIGHGFRKLPQKLFTSRKQGTGKWCKFSPRCDHNSTEEGGDMDKVKRTWGLAEYYSKLSWDWAIYQGGTSRLQPGETPNQLKYIKRIWHPESDLTA
eukprot:scaffold69837_cov23-Cyclotella_meneghiniana.AAC.1